MTDMMLHGLELSGNCDKIRLFRSLLGLLLEIEPVDFLAGAPIKEVGLARKKSAHILGLLESHFKTNDWLALNRRTIADIACMPYVVLGHEGGVSLKPYPAINAWIERIKALPNFISMPAL